jgi:membrane-associated phospholipid phosphatase
MPVSKLSEFTGMNFFSSFLPARVKPYLKNRATSGSNSSMRTKTATLFLVLLLCVPVFSTDYFAVAGDIGQFALPVAALGTALFHKDWKGCFQFCAAFATTMGITYTLKYTVKELRPDGGQQSFPSGHTSSAFCGATFLDIRYGPEWGIPSYIAAALVGWTRIESNKHYPQDVVVGAALGIISNLVFTRSGIKNLKVVPVAGSGAYGAVAFYQW